MKADITRSTYNKNKKYVKVNAQQGRVQIDADWNEQLDIQANLDKTLLRDIVGKTGTPLENPGFKITPTTIDPKTVKILTSFFEKTKMVITKKPNLPTVDFTIGEGRYYVDGIICENDSEKNALQQNDLPYNPLVSSNVIVPNEDGFYVVYLDVWPRHITFIEDPDLREVALGRADTTTRTKNVWQVKTIKVTDSQKALSEFEDQMANVCSTGKLSVSVNENSGYIGDDNRLYRVEIHKSGKIVDGFDKSRDLLPTFKWSRENASVAAKVTAITGLSTSSSDKISLVVENKGKDDLHHFAAGQWVEITDDYHELWNIPCEILKIDEVEEDPQENKSILKIRRTTDIVEYLQIFDPDTDVCKVRRWNTPDDKWVVLGYSEVFSSNSAEPVNPCITGKVDLEDGIQLQFTEGTYVAGDYWLFPARTLTKNVEWPTTPVEVSSMMEHHYCPLALLQQRTMKSGEVFLDVICDYREFFSAATNFLNFYYISGDGQEITPNNVIGNTNESPILLCVGVSKMSNTSTAQELSSNFFVRFEVKEGSGKLKRMDKASSALGSCIDVPIVDGKACCGWLFDANPNMSLNDKSQVSATLWQYVNGLDAVNGSQKSERIKFVDTSDAVAELEERLVGLVAPIFFNATPAQPILHYADGDGQQIRLTDSEEDKFRPLRVYLTAAGIPITNNTVLPLWGVAVKFTIDKGSGDLSSDLGGDLDPNDIERPHIIIRSLDLEGFVTCNWTPDTFTPRQTVKVELLNKDNESIGSALFFNATRFNDIGNQTPGVATVATSGVLKIIITQKMAEKNLIISDPIAHSIESDVPPAILLSMLSSETSEAHTETTVESFEDFCLYNWNTLTESGLQYPNFKAVHVNQKSFCILMQQPLNSGQTLYLRWWAIPAQDTNIQTTTFKAVITEPKINILDSTTLKPLEITPNKPLNASTPFTIEVIDQNITTNTVNITLDTSLTTSLLNFSTNITLERTTPNSFTASINLLKLLIEQSIDITSLKDELTTLTDNNNLQKLTIGYHCRDYPSFNIYPCTCEIYVTFKDLPPKVISDIGVPRNAKTVTLLDGMKSDVLRSESDLGVEKVSVTEDVKGSEVLVDVESEALESESVLESVQFIGNKNSRTLHLSTCKSLPGETNSVFFDSYDAAITAGYKPCSACKPAGLLEK